MGLDMYLKASKYVSGYSFSNGDDKSLYSKLLDAVGLALKDIDKDTPSGEISFTVAYWRKANAIHAWFVRNCQDGKDECQHTYVERDKLTELRDTIDRVLADRGLASELLPTQSGFFFGGTDYDEWYWQDLERTSKKLTRLLGDEGLNGWDFYYHSSW